MYTPMPMRICTSSEMRHIDEIADKEYGLDASVLMENAGRAAAQIMIEKYPHAGRTTEILVFAGKGNNAGDAFVVARALICMERKVRVFHLHTEEGYKGASHKNFKILKNMKAKLTHLDTASDLQSFFSSSVGPFSIVDGILGTGLKDRLDGIYYDLVEIINSLNANEVIALDIPTGVSGDTGAIQGTSVLATLTISFGFPKLGHFLPPGAGRRGELVNIDISLPPRFVKEGDKFLLTKIPLGTMIKARDRYGHKNSFGHTLLIGGSPGRVGAIAMAAAACHRMGTGLVTVATWEDCLDTLDNKLSPETMSVPLFLKGPEYEIYRKSLNTYSSIVIGPGLGMRSDGKQLVEELLLLYNGPVVIDADALNIISEHKLQAALKKRRFPTVITPHPGEISRLLGMAKDTVTENPLQTIRDAVSATHSVVILKGAATLISSPEETVYLNHYPNDGMATAGSGDVLAGMIGGLLGQKMDPFQGTLLGIYLHSLAGDFAAQNRGHRSMTARDIIENIGNAFKEIKKSSEPRLQMDGRAWLL
jgi:NAD(P)H-hydrate epimerase